MTSEGEDSIIKDERITKAVENGDITLTLNPEKQSRSKKLKKSKTCYATIELIQKEEEKRALI
ncbi:MAG: hypothetical protein LUC50_05230, partial [Ruminococcus sp.]|nr:hypothetical protein [Ruminococcus sp.]